MSFNIAVERATLLLALTCKNAEFAGPDGGGHHRLTISSTIETCKFVGAELQAYYAGIITRVLEVYPRRRRREMRI